MNKPANMIKYGCGIVKSPTISGDLTILRFDYFPMIRASVNKRLMLKINTLTTGVTAGFHYVNACELYIHRQDLSLYHPNY